MKWNSAEREEPDQSLENRFGDAHQWRREGGADSGAEELREGQDAAGQHQDDERGDETGFCGFFIYSSLDVYLFKMF